MRRPPRGPIATKISLASLPVLVAVMASCGNGDPVAGPSPTPTILATEDAPAGDREVWEGAWEDENRNPSVVSRSDGNVVLIVAADGSVSGDGSATQVTEGSTGDYDIVISGTRDQDAFRLRWTGPGGSIHIVVPIQGATASGSGEVRAGGSVYAWTMTLDCVNCPN